MAACTLLFIATPNQGWREIQQGRIQAGSEFMLRYEPARLPRCRSVRHGAEMWNIIAHVKFFPGGQLWHGSVLEDVRDPPGSPGPNGSPAGAVVWLPPAVVRVPVPSGTNALEIWFENTNSGLESCNEWDSRGGQNYRFTVDS
jgi:hypothetical protein